MLFWDWQILVCIDETTPYLLTFRNYDCANKEIVFKLHCDLLEKVYINFCSPTLYKYSVENFSLKAIGHFQNRKKKIKVHRFTNNLQGLKKVMVKDFSWNVIPWNALLFEKTVKQLSILNIKNYGFIVNTCHDTAKRAETRVGFPVIFSRLRWPIEP